jgi:hypothetical protein
MARVITLLVLMIVSLSVTPFALFALPEVTLPLLRPVLCDADQTLESSFSISRSGSQINGGFVCMSGGERAVRDVTLPVVIAAATPTLVFGFLLILALITESASRNRLLNEGEPGVGRVTGIAYTGMRINQRPVYRLSMEVFTRDRPSYSATVNKRSGYYGISGPQFGVGSLLPLKIDPRDQNNILVDDDAELDPLIVKKAGGTTASAMPAQAAVAINMVNEMLGQFAQPGAVSQTGDTLSDRLAQLKAAHDKGLITAQEYEEQRKRLLNAL